MSKPTPTRTYPGTGAMVLGKLAVPGRPTYFDGWLVVLGLTAL